METQLLEIMLWSSLVALLLLLPRKRELRPLGQILIHGFRPIGPNWITAYSLVITLVGLALYAYRTSPVLGCVVVAVGGILDRLDGKMAEALGECFDIPKPIGKPFFSGEMLRYRWKEFNHGGPTVLGAVSDPFGDKVKSLVIFFYLAQQGVLSLWLVYLLVIPELVGTLIRPPFDLLKDYIAKTKASGVGKLKVLVQWTTVIIAVPYHKHWIQSDHWAYGLNWILNGFLGLTVLLAVASVASRFKSVRQKDVVNKIMTSLEKSVKHE